MSTLDKVGSGYLDEVEDEVLEELMKALRKHFPRMSAGEALGIVARVAPRFNQIGAGLLAAEIVAIGVTKLIDSGMLDQATADQIIDNAALQDYQTGYLQNGLAAVVTQDGAYFQEYNSDLNKTEWRYEPLPLTPASHPVPLINVTAKPGFDNRSVQLEFTAAIDQLVNEAFRFEQTPNIPDYQLGFPCRIVTGKQTYYQIQVLP